MAQRVSSGWPGGVTAPFRNLQHGVLISFGKGTVSGVQFFTIGQSRIGGNDIIKGGGDTITFSDQFNYVDYAEYALQWSVMRKLGQYPWGIIMAEADIELDNTSKKFLPGFDPIIGSGILPARPVKLSVGVNKETLNQFVGITGIPENSTKERKLSYHAFDAFEYVNDYVMTASGTPSTVSGMLHNKRTDEIIDYYLQAIGFSPSQYVLDVSLQPPIGFFDVTDRKLGDAFRDLVEAEMGMLFADENGVIRFWNRQHFLTVSGLGTAFNFNYSNIIEFDQENTPIINDVEVLAKPREVKPTKKIFELNGTEEIPANTTIDKFYEFTDDDGAVPVVGVITPVYITSAVSSLFQGNASEDGTGADAASFLSIVSTQLFGTKYRIRWRNAGSIPYFVTKLVMYGNPASIRIPISERFVDEASIRIFGRNAVRNGEPIVIENNAIQDESTAASIAQTIVETYKTQRRRYRAKVFARPELQIGDYGSLTIPDTGETKSVYITGITTSLDQNADLVQDLIFEEREIPKYFQIGTSAIGGTDKIAP